MIYADRTLIKLMMAGLTLIKKKSAPIMRIMRISVLSKNQRSIMTHQEIQLHLHQVHQALKPVNL